jgi:hypothetical protein
MIDEGSEFCRKMPPARVDRTSASAFRPVDDEESAEEDDDAFEEEALEAEPARSRFG